LELGSQLHGLSGKNLIVHYRAKNEILMRN